LTDTLFSNALEARRRIEIVLKETVLTLQNYSEVDIVLYTSIRDQVSGYSTRISNNESLERLFKLIADPSQQDWWTSKQKVLSKVWNVYLNFQPISLRDLYQLQDDNAILVDIWRKKIDPNYLLTSHSGGPLTLLTLRQRRVLAGGLDPVSNVSRHHGGRVISEDGFVRENSTLSFFCERTGVYYFQEI
jgi:hypothetical protein